MPLVLMRLRVILILGLYLTSKQCHCQGFENLSLRELCKKLPNNGDTMNVATTAKYCMKCPAKKCPSMGSSQSGTFSCSSCEPGSMYEPFICDACFRGTEDDEEFSCTNCKLGPSKSKRIICQQCDANHVQPTGCEV